MLVKKSLGFVPASRVKAEHAEYAHICCVVLILDRLMSVEKPDRGFWWYRRTWYWRRWFFYRQTKLHFEMWKTRMILHFQSFSWE